MWSDFFVPRKLNAKKGIYIAGGAKELKYVIFALIAIGAIAMKSIILANVDQEDGLMVQKDSFRLTKMKTIICTFLFSSPLFAEKYAIYTTEKTSKFWSGIIDSKGYFIGSLMHILLP